jgi:hypothetical protein
MRAPKNLVKVKYTRGEKYVDSNFIPYTGYYCELQGKAYPGKVYTGVAKPLKLISSLAKSNNKINSHIFIPDGKEYVLRYFIKYINTVPVYLKEIDNATYNKVKDNPLYQTIFLEYRVADVESGVFVNGFFNMNEVEQADKKMPGIKLFLQDELV